MEVKADLDRPTTRNSPPVLEALGVSKSFSGVPVLAGVSMSIRSGEVHTLMGENGAGKSTLMKILAGVHQPDAGRILLDGNQVAIHSAHAAGRMGIALIHQEPLSFPDLSVAENIFLGHRMPKGLLGQIDWTTMRNDARRELTALGVELNPSAKLRGLSIADQQMVELASALSRKARVLLMDEPTAALTPREVERLFTIVRRLRDAGVAIVFVSHRLPEVFDVSDRITVLRDGNFVGERQVNETTTDEIIRLMVGRDLNSLYERAQSTPGEPLLELDNLHRVGSDASVSFTVRAGEIVGLAGLVGSGRTEISEAIFGLRPVASGSIRLSGQTVKIRSPRDAVEHRLAYVPEDRQQNGLLLPMSIAANTSLAALKTVSLAGWISPGKERGLAETWRQKLSTRLRTVDQPARELSGGNQQKIVLGKWLATKPRVLIVDEPTRGIDVGAKAEVHHLLAELARQGCAVLIISSDLPEVLAMSDRILVMRAGAIAAEYSQKEATQEKVMAAATGTVKRDEIPAADASEPPVFSYATPKPGLARHAARFHELGIMGLIVALFFGTGARNHHFFSTDTIHTTFVYIALILIVAIGQLMVIVTRNIDLSVGSTLGLSAMVAGGMFVGHPHFSIWAAALLAMGVGALAGVVNGVLIAWLRVPSIITTLGTLTAYRGLVYIWSGGLQVDPDKIPVALKDLSQYGPLGVPWLVCIALGVAATGAIFLRYTTTGRQIYAIGSNPTAAPLRGIPVTRLLILVFTLTGALSGLAGILYAARVPTINPSSVGVQSELEVISAVVIGGAAVAGGSGTVLGTILGCLLLGEVHKALPMLDVPEDWQIAFYGGAIILAAVFESIMRRKARSQTI